MIVSSDVYIFLNSKIIKEENVTFKTSKVTDLTEWIIKARIDSHNKVLLAQDVDHRSQTFEKAVEMAGLHNKR